MSQGPTKYDTFLHGSAWVRADFHLHTNADKASQFSCNGPENDFAASYIEGLKEAQIKVGVITNHNKFAFEQFKALRKKARKEEILLLPGVELSCKDGANGIHILICFSEEWVKHSDSINPFLNNAFSGQDPAVYEHEDGRTTLDLPHILKSLDGYQKDYFLVFAHVDQKSGLFKELAGGNQLHYLKSADFRRRILGFQKVRSRDNEAKARTWWGDNYPAQLEGCDCKSIKEIGKGEKCYLKIGDFSFQAVKLALQDHHHRVASEPPQSNHSHIKSVSFEGGLLNNETIPLSPELNTLIGIRGSGKSSILESIRYVLNVPFGDQAEDQDYKAGSVKNLLRSGGKVVVEAVDAHGRPCRIERDYDGITDVYIDGQARDGVTIAESLIFRPVYFGQKDLSRTREGFELDLVEKLVGSHLREVRERIAEQKLKLSDAIDSFLRLSNQEEKLDEWERKKTDAEVTLEVYQKHGLEKKLARQVAFQRDEEKCRDLDQSFGAFITDLESTIAEHEDELRNHLFYKSDENDAFFLKYFVTFRTILEGVDRIKAELAGLRTGRQQLLEQAEELKTRHAALREEFLEQQRAIQDELPTGESANLSTAEFLKLQRTVEHADKMLRSLQGAEEEKARKHRQLIEALKGLQDLYREEAELLEQRLDEVNDNSDSLKIEVKFQAEKDLFTRHLTETFKGTGIRSNYYKQLTEKFSNYGAVYRSMDQAKELMNTFAPVFEARFLENLKGLLLWQVPNRVRILYHGRELNQHSLGQRASALILFVLNCSDADLFILDQPEDDLDNQTIYEDVIKLLQKKKQNAQFIMATHNPNFPVLGDAEQVLSCHYEGSSIDVRVGSIDRSDIQNDIIDIMEGGEEAFRRRRSLYTQWMPQNSTKS